MTTINLNAEKTNICYNAVSFGNMLAETHVNCTFICCTFTEAEILSSEFINCKFHHCSFTETTIKRNTILENCKFHHCTFFRAIIRNYSILGKTYFLHCSVSYSNIYAPDSKYTSLIIRNVDIEQSNVSM